MHLARQRPPGGVSAARQRVPRGDSGGPQRRPRADHPELALFGGRPLARRGGGDAGGIAGGGAGEGEIVLESTANGAAGASTPSGSGQRRRGYVRHFFPWWWEPSYRLADGRADRRVERGRSGAGRSSFGLDGEQIAFRREMRANFGARFAEEFPEDAETCFLASGECVFDREAIERRMRRAGAAGRERAKRLSADVAGRRRRAGDT